MRRASKEYFPTCGCSRPRGYLVYSTCTYNPGENEDILNWILTTFDASSVEIRHNFTAITPSPSPLHGYHFYPHKTSGEGLFMGVIQKNDGTPFTMKKEKRATPSPAVKLPADILPLLPDMTKYTPYIAGETLGILPKQHAEFIQYLSSKAGVIYKGCEIGECIREDETRPRSGSIPQTATKTRYPSRSGPLHGPPIPTQRRHPFRGPSRGMDSHHLQRHRARLGKRSRQPGK